VENESYSRLFKKLKELPKDHDYEKPVQSETIDEIEEDKDEQRIRNPRNRSIVNGVRG
jgi:hypothetical protein